MITYSQLLKTLNDFHDMVILNEIFLNTILTCIDFDNLEVFLVFR